MEDYEACFSPIQAVPVGNVGVLGAALSAGCILSPQLQRSPLRYPSHPFQLTATPRGSLSNVVAKPLQNIHPGPGQILLRVLAVGVNFRDVLNVLGMYPGDPGEPGGDVAGIVEAVGTEVLNQRLPPKPLFLLQTFSIEST